MLFKRTHFRLVYSAAGPDRAVLTNQIDFLLPGGIPKYANKYTVSSGSWQRLTAICSLPARQECVLTAGGG